MQTRERRIALGLSRGKLATALGVALQQLLKDEKGANRVAAGRWTRAARVLEVAVGFSCTGIPAPDANTAVNPGGDLARAAQSGAPDLALRPAPIPARG